MSWHLNATLGKILYEETFDNNDAYWETASDNAVVSELRDGRYVIEYVPAQPGMGWIVAPGIGNPEAVPFFQPPYEIEFEVSNVFSRSGQYKVIALFHVQADYAGWLQLNLDNDGAWALYDTATDSIVDRGGAEPVDFLDGNTHVMTVRIWPNSYEFLVDGRTIASGPVNLNWERGTVGFGVGAGTGDSKEYVEAHFDNLIVRELLLPGELTEAEPSTAPETGLPDFTEDFSNNDNGWYLYPEYSLKDGVLQITVPEEGAIYGATVPNQSRSDFALTVDIASETIGSYQYGVWFRSKNGLDNGYYFVIEPQTSNYALALGLDGEWQEDAIPWQSSSQIKRNGINQLGIVASGNQITLYINGVQVNSIVDDKLDSGEIMLLAGTYQNEVAPIVVRFDNLVITSAENAHFSQDEETTATVLDDFEDDFSDNRNGWGRDRDVSLRDGTLQITLHGNAFAIALVPDDERSDFALKVDTTAETVGHYEHGIWFRTSEDLADFYYFVIEPSSGTYWLALSLDGEWQGLIIPSRYSPQIRPDTNQLGIVASGDQISLYINGVQVDSVRDDRLSSGYIWLVTAPYDDRIVYPITTHFDNLVITSGGDSDFFQEQATAVPTEGPETPTSTPVPEEEETEATPDEDTEIVQQNSDAGIVVGPALWDGAEGSRVTLCEVVGNTRPQGLNIAAGDTTFAIDCVLHAELTTTLDSDRNFILYDVPPGWYLFFYENPPVDPNAVDDVIRIRIDATDNLRSEMDTYDEILEAWDGQAIPIGNGNFSSETFLLSEELTLVFMGECPLGGSAFQNNIVYQMWTFAFSPMRLATNLTRDIVDCEVKGISFATTEVRPGVAVRVGFGDVQEVDDIDNDSLSNEEDNCPINRNPDQADSDGDGFGDTCDLCAEEAGTAGGCPDADGDGVPDTKDVCPDEPGSIAAQGCPDADGDGVVDADDECPDQAGTAEMGGCLYTGTVSGNVNLREGPGTDFNIVGTVVPDEEFAILGRNPAGDWLRIRTTGKNAIDAWIFASLVVTDVSVSDLPEVNE